jgi:hypothetical protein
MKDSKPNKIDIHVSNKYYANCLTQYQVFITHYLLDSNLAAGEGCRPGNMYKAIMFLFAFKSFKTPVESVAAPGIFLTKAVLIKKSHILIECTQIQISMKNLKGRSLVQLLTLQES